MCYKFAHLLSFSWVLDHIWLIMTNMPFTALEHQTKLLYIYIDFKNMLILFIL